MSCKGCIAGKYYTGALIMIRIGLRSTLREGALMNITSNPCKTKMAYDSFWESKDVLVFRNRLQGPEPGFGSL